MNTTSDTKIRSVNPYTMEVLAELNNASAKDASLAVTRAWQMFLSNDLDLEKRLALVMSLKDLIVERADEIAQLISLEVGKPISECYSSEIASVLDTCSWLNKNAKTILAPRKVKLANPLFSGNQSYLEYEPLGVVAVIAPWNFPFSIPLTTILHAIVAGNTVVLKPSEKSPLVALKIKELFEAAGLPDGLLNVVVGDKEAGIALSTSSQISRLVLTGSVEAGKKVMAQVAGNLTPLTLELGGKDAAIVLPDAPVDFTARGLVWGAFMNGGQACASIERVFIVKGPKTKALLSALKAKVEALRVGNPLDPSVEIGPVIDLGQLEKIEFQVNHAVKLGATLVCGGSRPKELKGFFYSPTLVTDVDTMMSYMHEETFGPVLWVKVVDSVNEAVRLSNATDFGLTASIWTASRTQAASIVPKLKVGTVYVNDCIFSHAAPELPWGGVKMSGIGRSHSQIGLLDMVHVKNTNYNTANSSGRLWWYPYRTRQFDAIRGGIQLLHGKQISRRLKGLVSFLSGVVSRRS